MSLRHECIDGLFVYRHVVFFTCTYEFRVNKCYQGLTFLVYTYSFHLVYQHICMLSHHMSLLLFVYFVVTSEGVCIETYLSKFTFCFVRCTKVDVSQFVFVFVVYHNLHTYHQRRTSPLAITDSILCLKMSSRTKTIKNISHKRNTINSFYT